MGRQPHGGGPVFRFTHNEVLEMEAFLQEANNAIPSREIISSLAEKFSVSVVRSGKIVVQPKQVLNWFQNRRYAQRSKSVKTPGKINALPTPQDDSAPFRNAAHPVSAAASGRISSEDTKMEFEGKSARDGAWYDVACFVSHRYFETGNPEVCVRFMGFGMEEEEWINVRKCVRQQSLPCEAAECVVVLPGDLILCFQEGKEQALYFDAQVLDAQRRRHDVRGCRCRFLVRYDHDQSEEIVPLRKVCRRPETDYRLRILYASKAPGSSASKHFNLAAQKIQKQRKLMDVNTDKVIAPSLPRSKEPVVIDAPRPTTAGSGHSAISDALISDAVPTDATGDIPQEGKAAAV